MARKVTNTTHADSVLSSDELKKALEEYKARRAQRLNEKKDAEDTEKPAPAENPADVSDIPAKAQDGEEEPAPAPAAPKAPTAPEKTPVEEKVQEIKEKEDGEDPNETIARQDEDIQTLIDIIDTLLAEKDFGEAKAPAAEDCATTDGDDEMLEEKQDGEDTENCDEDDDPIPSTEGNADSDDDDIPSEDTSDMKPGQAINADSVDAIIRERIKVGMMGQKLNMDGLENMNLISAKKAIINAVRPGIRLDGKSDTYITAMYDLACDEIRRRETKDTAYQRRQMFNAKTAKRMDEADGNSSQAARQRMIERMQNRKKEDK